MVSLRGVYCVFIAIWLILGIGIGTAIAIGPGLVKVGEIDGSPASWVTEIKVNNTALAVSGNVATVDVSALATSGSAGSLKSPATTGKTTITGPGPGTTRNLTIPDSDATLLYSGGALGTPSSGTLTNCTGLPLAGMPQGTAGYILTGTGASAPEYSNTLNIGPAAAVPELLLRDTDAAGADDADEDAASIKANQSTTTEDAEVSDLFFTSLGSATAGTEYTNYWWDSSAASLYLGIMTDSTTPAEVAGYEYLRFNFNTSVDAQIEITSVATELLFTSVAIVGPVGLKANAGAVTLTAAQMNRIQIQAGTGDVDIPADLCDTATGNWLTVKATTAAVSSITLLDTADMFVLSNGTALDAQDELDTAGAAGNQCTVVCIEAHKWHVMGEIGTCADGNVAD